MTHTEFLNKLKTGELELISNGHLVNDDIFFRLIEQFITDYKESKLANLILNIKEEPEINDCEYLKVPFNTFTRECECCGEDITLLLSYNKVYLVERNLYRLDDPIIDEIKNVKCNGQEILEHGKFETDINIPSGKLHFANCFRGIKDAPVGKEYKNEYSLCNMIGLNNTTQYLGKHNFAFGQMTNTSVDVFINDDGTEIIIGTDYGYNDEDGEYEIIHEGFTKVGNISCDIWRWMCADAEYTKDLQVRGDDFTLDVKIGTWHMEHYFQHKESDIYSRLKLKQ